MAQYPERVLATPITNVFFSTYAALQENREELSKAFFRSSSFLVRAGLLMAGVLIIAAPEVTLILFGETWLPIVPVFRLMLVYIMLDPIYVNLSYLIIAVGQPDWLTRVRLIQAVLFAVAVVVFAQVWGINGVAMAANLMMLSGTLILLAYSRRFVGFSLSRMFFWPMVASAASIAVTFLLIYGVQWTSFWWTLVLKSVSVLGIYVSILYLAERQIVHEYSSQVLRLLSNRSRANTPSESV
jgi:PST family polysaccharide transporter